MATEIERRITALEQRHGIDRSVVIAFQCPHCNAIAASIDELEICGHHRAPPAAAIRVVVGFGKPAT